MPSRFEPRVSVIIPVYNGANYLREALDSALAQSYDNIEVIVVNDGSKDSTHDIAMSYGKRISYYHKDNGGVASALNYGIENSTGEYISWLSHDDVYYPNKIEKQITLLKTLDNSKTLIYSSYECINSIGKLLYKVDLQAMHGQLNLQSGLYATMRGCLHGCTLLIPRIYFDEKGLFNPQLLYTQDYDLWFRFFQEDKRIYHIDDCLVKSRIHNEQTSQVNPRSLDECNSLWIKMVNGVTEDLIKKVFINRLFFLRGTIDLLNENGYTLACQFVSQLIDNEKNMLISKQTPYPLVSVIIPCFNQGEYLSDAINSVIKQTYKSIEIIVVNDGSIDNTDERAALFGESIHYYKTENQGVSKARNFGLSKASGDYIQFLDADDILLPNKIYTQLQYLKDYPEVDIQYCDFYYRDINNNIILNPTPESLTLSPLHSYEDLLFNWQRPLSIPIHVFLFKRECFDKIDFIYGMVMCEDWILWLTFARMGFLFAHNKFIGAEYRVHQYNTSQRKEYSFYHTMLAISYIRNNLVDSSLLCKFDQCTSNYIAYLSRIMLQDTNSSSSTNNNCVHEKSFPLMIKFSRVLDIWVFKIRRIIDRIIYKYKDYIPKTFRNRAKKYLDRVIHLL